MVVTKDSIDSQMNIYIYIGRNFSIAKKNKHLVELDFDNKFSKDVPSQ